MKNPWMRFWLSTVSSSLEATRAFWTHMLRQPTAEERDRASDGSEAAAAKEPKAAALRSPQAPAAEPAETSGAKPKSDDPEDSAVKPSRKPSERPPDVSKGASAGEAVSEAKRGRAAERPKVATEKRSSSQKKPKPRSSAARKTSASEPKYRNPDDPSQTWSGRGRRPRWITQALEVGRKLDEFEAGKR